MSLEEKFLWNPLIDSPIMINQGLINVSGVSHSNLFIPPQTTNKQPPGPIELTTRIRFQMCSGASSVQGLGVTFIPSQCPPGVLPMGA